MSYASSILPGLSIVCLSMLLFLLSPPPQLPDKIDGLGQGRNGLYDSQRKLRFGMNLLLMLVGLTICSTGFIEDRRTWAISWLVILCTLFVILALAMWDATRLIILYRRALPKIKHETIGQKSLQERGIPKQASVSRGQSNSENE
jgi:hypothetical protein